MDLYCQICGEPYEAYHVNHDMPPDEKTYFLEGLGCIYCKGIEPRGGRPFIAQASSAMMDMLGDDLDGVASMMDDYMFLME